MKEANKISAREITDPKVYFNRRNFIRAGILAASAVATGEIYRKLNPIGTDTGKTIETAKIEGVVKPAITTTNDNSGFRVDEKETSLQDITHYNNFYEFSTDKEEVAVKATNFKTDGWTVSVDGLINKPKTFALDDILKIASPEERVYRMRCVEAWSMVIPWIGFSFSKLLAAVEPLSSAKYVAFQTLLDPTRMPGQRSDVLD
ncbi:MAG TPA: molybdopterin-dependent oxidoreductase, partial [Candidatus Saccharimonadales bacterium]|nr:molybdopterin-dependent oxidoreductase [Candidatus Saccharimonadales bacterium]